MNTKIKWIFVALLILVIGFFGFTFTVREGTSAIVSSFGKVRVVYADAGLHFKWPWPFEKVLTYDTRSQYLDSGYTETLTNDKKNVILQTYIIWDVENAQKFHTSIGDMNMANKYLNDLVANVKNGVMGNYEFTALVSTNLENLKVNEISTAIETGVAQKALENYGIKVSSLKLKRIALPDANVQSVLSQMIADRQRYATQLIAEGERDSAIIISQANAEAAEIIARGKLEASTINAETERQIAEIYGAAYDQNSELFIFLKKLIALENSVNENTVIIMKGDEAPFDIINGLNGDDAGGSGDGEGDNG